MKLSILEYFCEFIILVLYPENIQWLTGWVFL